MIAAAQPDILKTLPMHEVRERELDATLVDDGRVRILFLWGTDCPNCDIAKAEMLRAPQGLRWPDVDWLHDNVYADPQMATRFGLHGIPALLVFRGVRKVGRIGQWPGTQRVIDAIERVRGG